jgi:hypothetical protein
LETKTLYIIGNGKSFDPKCLPLLKDKHTFGMNLGFKGFQQYNFCPTYYCYFGFEKDKYKLCDIKEIDDYLNKETTVKAFTCCQCTKDIKFTCKNVQRIVFRPPPISDIPAEYVLPTSFDVFYWQEMYSTAAACVLVGLVMGYNRFVLLGMDAKYVIKNRTASYSDNYWFDGGIIELGTLDDRAIHADTYLRGWRLLRNALEVNNRQVEIINATPLSPLCNLFITKPLTELV